MKRIVCAALALTLLGSTAAQAHDWHGGGRGWHGHGGGDVALGFGLGFLALGIIAAESNRDRHYDRDGYDRDGSDRDHHAYNDDGNGRDGYDRNRDRDDDGDRADGYRDDDARGAPAPLHRDNGDDDGED